MVLIFQQLDQVQWRSIVEPVVGFDERERRGSGRPAPGVEFRQRGWLGRFEHAVKPARDLEREDDFAVFAALLCKSVTR